MPDDFVIAHNPDGDSTLPYLVRVPLGETGIVLKSRDKWPRTSKVYCHRVDEWPDEPDIVERVATRSCVRRGAAIDLVLDRGRENRSQFVMTRVRGRQVIFWQSSRTAKQARPNVRTPTARAMGVRDLEIVVDSRERYGYSFSDRPVTTTKARLEAGDYGLVRHGTLLATVERKSLADLVSSMTTGKLKFQLTGLAAIPRAAVVVEDRYSAVFKLDRVRPAVVADGIAECQVAFPTVPIVFCETRKLAQEWTYRFLAAAEVAEEAEYGGARLVAGLAQAPPLAPAPPTPAEVRAWALLNGHAVAEKGRVPLRLVEAFEEARRG
ncbi:ERCC4 domain-containing protein [Nocardioides sp.]|uniref:ERCC4 domain-containing protein n=1 Tax=Nocardioides sp. TaxID=35761 RepID=UPI002C563D69|nr:ERCC4 domain-containing protein [Nocardioides sp.]HXH78953.1 ERCC4 domain-containing protein [Nocardioides sp.]